MANYMVQAAYTNDAWGRLVQRPEDRAEALRPVVERLGGQLLSWYYSFGDYDVMALIELPNNMNAAALSMAAAAGKAVRTVRTTPLMTPDEGFEALLLAQGAKYVPPGA